MQPKGLLLCSLTLKLVPVLSHTNSVHILPSYFFKIYSNVILFIYAYVFKWSLILRLPTKILYPLLFSLLHATCPTHLILLDFITLIISGEETNYKTPLYAVSFSTLLLPPSEAQIFSSALYSQTPSSYVLHSKCIPICNRQN